MCKTPATDCQAVAKDIPQDEEPVSSADESEATSSGHSYMTDSSGDECSDSDAESASGNRVTPSMLIWHLMKEKGLISEEHYRLVQDNIDPASVMKVAPKVSSFATDSDNDDSYSFGTDEDDDEFDEVSDDESEMMNNSKVDEGVGVKETSNGNQDMGYPSNTVLEEECVKVDVVKENDGNKHCEIIGDTLNTEKLICHRILDTKNKTEATKSEDKSVNIGAKGDGLGSNTRNNQSDLQLAQDKAGIESNEVQSATVNKETLERETIKSEAVADTIGNKIDIAMAEQGTECAEKECNKVETNTNDKEIPKHEAKVTIGRTVSANIKPIPETDVEGRRIESIENILKEMTNEKRIQEEDSLVLETYTSELDEFYYCNRATEKFSEPNKTLREFALFLHYYSPSAYNYIRETFVTPLPGHKVLSSWYLQDDDSPGLTKRAFDILKSKAAGRKLYCTLMSDAVFLTNIGLNYDQVDFGGGCNYEYTDKAVMVFVLMLVGLEDNWKIPIGYVRARHVPAETHAALIRVCLTQCHEAGVHVVAVALDTPSPAEFLGCKFDDVTNLKTTFKHPECDRDVAVWIDPCLAIRSIYHTMKSKILIYFDDRKIRWNMVRRLRRLYSNDFLDYEETHTPSHLKLRNHVAKVGLASATLSDSLRPALSLCEEVFPRMFKNSQTTSHFIGAVNNLYEILNSKQNLDSGYQRAIDVNSKDVLVILDVARGYFVDIFRDPRNGLSMRDKDNFKEEGVRRSFVDGKPVCGFVIYLICIESLKHLFATLVKTGEIGRLATHRLCKDHVEDFVKHMRRNEGVEPEDFTAWNYQSYITVLLEELDRKPRLSDRSVSVEYYPIENKCSPAVEIKLTSGKRSYDEDYNYRPKKLPKNCHEERATKIVRGLSVALDTESDQATRKHMVAYLAGWIAAKFAKCLKCEECVDSLLSDKKLWFHKFITFRELSGVCLPSEELFRVCWECERVLRSGAPAPQCRVLRRLRARWPWRAPAAHPALHRVHLVRAIVSKYIPLRVAVPLSSKETLRMTQMFDLIKCMHMSGFIQQMGPPPLNPPSHRAPLNFFNCS